MKITRFVAPLLIVALLATAGCPHGDVPSKATEVPPGIRYEAHIAAGGVQPPSMELKNPHMGTRENIQSGGGLFSSMNCDGCHGGGAPGWVGPSLIDGRWRYGGSDEEVFESIYYGRPKGMPAYGGVLGNDGVWMLVAYLKAQHPPDVVPTTSWEPGGSAAPAPAGSAPAAAPAAETTSTAAPAAPASPEQMVTKYGCNACHAVDKKVIGPSFKDVAAKYRGQPDAEGKLVEKVRNGGSGVWGQIPMTPNPQVPDQDLHALVKWILSLK
jgi:cytochrome c